MEVSAYRPIAHMFHVKDAVCDVDCSSTELENLWAFPCGDSPHSTGDEEDGESIFCKIHD